MALIPQFFLDRVAAIFIQNVQKEKTQVASGFLFGYFIEKISESESKYKLYFVTNRHVFNNKQQIGIRFNSLEGESPKEYDIELIDKQGQNTWLSHPNDTIDIAVIPINADKLNEDKVRFCFFRSDQDVMTRKKAKELGLSEGDLIFLMDFPLPDKIEDMTENYVIVRQGGIARIRDCLVNKSNTFLIDVANFPGNSGGPVVNKPETVAIQGTSPINFSNLIGIISAYKPYQDVAISQQTGRPRVIFEENSNLAIAYPTDFILETIEKSLNVKEVSPTPREQ